ncbi:MAG: DUF1016 N-terminal domain-containing protein [Lachnospiraceae bacterium]
MLSEQLTAEFGKGFDKSNLRKMQQFCALSNSRHTVSELSWSHYRVLMRINEEQALIDHLQHFLLGLGRDFHLLQIREDSIVKYTLPEDNHQIFASKYFTYLPSEEELKRELNLKEFHKKE